MAWCCKKSIRYVESGLGWAQGVLQLEQLAGDHQGKLAPIGPGAAALAPMSLAGLAEGTLLPLCCLCPRYPQWDASMAPASSGWLRARLMGSLLSLKALRLVGELDQAERWLQDVAGSLVEPTAMRSPAELRQDLEEMSRLEKQLLLCGLKLQALREEAAGEVPTEHEGARKMQRKVEIVEEK